jgi:hypothetical protein
VREAFCDGGEEAWWVDAVVVGEGDEVGSDRRERSIARSGEPALGPEVHEIERATCYCRVQAVVRVLIHEEDAQRRVVLRLDRVEEARELRDAAHRRDDEVERRGLPGHGP